MVPARKRLLSYDLAVVSPASSVKITKKSNSGEARSCMFLAKRKKGKQNISRAKKENRSQDLDNRVLESLLDSCDKRAVPNCHPRSGPQEEVE